MKLIEIEFRFKRIKAYNVLSEPKPIGAVIPKTKMLFSNQTVEFEMHQFRSVQKYSREPDLFSRHSSSHTINYAQSRTIGNRFMCSSFRLSSPCDVYVFFYFYYGIKNFFSQACVLSI